MCDCEVLGCFVLTWLVAQEASEMVVWGAVEYPRKERKREREKQREKPAPGFSIRYKYCRAGWP